MKTSPSLPHAGASLATADRPAGKHAAADRHASAFSQLLTKQKAADIAGTIPAEKRLVERHQDLVARDRHTENARAIRIDGLKRGSTAADTKQETVDEGDFGSASKQFNRLTSERDQDAGAEPIQLAPWLDQERSLAKAILPVQEPLASGSDSATGGTVSQADGDDRQTGKVFQQAEHLKFFTEGIHPDRQAPYPADRASTRTQTDHQGADENVSAATRPIVDTEPKVGRRETVPRIVQSEPASQQQIGTEIAPEKTAPAAMATTPENAAGKSSAQQYATEKSHDSDDTHPVQRKSMESLASNAAATHTGDVESNARGNTLSSGLGDPQQESISIAGHADRPNSAAQISNSATMQAGAGNERSDEAFGAATGEGMDPPARATQAIGKSESQSTATTELIDRAATSSRAKAEQESRSRPAPPDGATRILEPAANGKDTNDVGSALRADPLLVPAQVPTDPTTPIAVKSHAAQDDVRSTYQKVVQVPNGSPEVTQSEVTASISANLSSPVEEKNGLRQIAGPKQHQQQSAAANPRPANSPANPAPMPPAAATQPSLVTEITIAAARYTLSKIDQPTSSAKASKSENTATSSFDDRLATSSRITYSTAFASLDPPADGPTPVLDETPLPMPNFNQKNATEMDSPHDRSKVTDTDRADRKTPVSTTPATPSNAGTTAVATPAIPAAPLSPASTVVVAITAEPSWRPAPVASATQSPLDRIIGSPKTLSVQLNPGDLGVVTATLSMSGARLKVDLAAESSEAHDRLKAESHTIEKAMHALGYEVSEIVITQSLTASTSSTKPEMAAQSNLPAGRDAPSSGSQNQAGGDRAPGQNGDRNGHGTASHSSVFATHPADRTRNGIYI